MSHVRARQLVPDFNTLLPSVEACHKGAIPIKKVRKQIVYDRLAIGKLHIFDGQLLSEKQIAVLEEEHKSAQPSEIPEWFLAHFANGPSSSGPDPI